MMTEPCSSCDATAAWIFNDDTVSCDDCREERLNDGHLETESDLSWPITWKKIA
jgi:hypothetical protein